MLNAINYLVNVTAAEVAGSFPPLVTPTYIPFDHCSVFEAVVDETPIKGVRHKSDQIKLFQYRLIAVVGNSKGN